MAANQFPPMSRCDWRGVIPAITTPFDAGLAVDHAFLAHHAAWMVDAGCTGIVAAGSLGEGATLSHDERTAILRTLIGAVGDRVPIIATVSALSTAEAVRIARDAKTAGCRGLMVLPPYVYRGDWRETRAHFAAVIRATDLSCMLYNNPIAYGTDVTPSQVAELAVEFPSLHAVKESSADVRRVTAIRSLLGDRLSVLVGVDDLIGEGISAGAEGWIAGLVNAMPAESVSLFNLAREAARSGDWSRATALYRWFLPLLRLDVVPEFVHLIKLVQQEVGMGSERVRPPRLELAGEAREQAIEIIRTAIMTKPAI